MQLSAYLDVLALSVSEHGRICAHYERALEWLVRHFGSTPVIAVTYPGGLGTEPVYHKGYPEMPATIGSVAVRTSTGVHAYPKLDAHNLTWLLKGRFAVEFHSWSPSLDDPERAAFGRLMLSPNAAASEQLVVTAAQLVRDALAAEKLAAIPILDGFRGMCLRIPFDDGPTYDRIGPWLRHAYDRTAFARPR